MTPGIVTAASRGWVMMVTTGWLGILIGLIIGVPLALVELAILRRVLPFPCDTVEPPPRSE